MERANPYADYGSTVTGARFLGRETELRTVASRVFGSGGFGSIAVVGLPRIGKTSLISEAIRRAESHPIGQRSVVVRANVGAFDSFGELFRHVIETMVEDVAHRGLGNAQVEKAMHKAIKGPEIGFSAIRAAFKSLRQADLRPVVVLDEFDAGRRVFESTPRCFHWLRELCSNPDFKAAVVLVAKRRLQDVARLAGHESNYWANVLMTLPLKPLSDVEVALLFSRLETEGVSLGAAERREVSTLCGGHPYLLDAFGYRAWEHVEHGGRIDIDWIGTTCSQMAREYFQQVSTVLDDGPMLSKAVQVFVGPQWDVSSEDVDALCELGLALRDENDTLHSFSHLFEDHLQFVERSIDIWPLWRDAERALREVLEHHLKSEHGLDWSSSLVRRSPKLKALIDACYEKRARERERFGAGLTDPSLLAYSYPMDLYALMCSNWPRLGEPLLGKDRSGWSAKFNVLSRVRTPLAHNREEAVDDGERQQAEGVCREILSLYRTWKNMAS